MKNSGIIASKELQHDLMIEELMDQLENPTSYVKNASILHKMVAKFTDAYFFYSPSGELRLLTGFSN